MKKVFKFPLTINIFLNSITLNFASKKHQTLNLLKENHHQPLKCLEHSGLISTGRQTYLLPRADRNYRLTLEYGSHPFSANNFSIFRCKTLFFFSKRIYYKSFLHHLPCIAYILLLFLSISFRYLNSIQTTLSHRRRFASIQ